MQFAAYADSYINVSFQPNQFTALKQQKTYLTAFYS